MSDDHSMSDAIDATSKNPAPFDLEALKKKFKQAREVFDQEKKVPVEQLESFRDYLRWAEADLVGTVYTQPDLKKFFFEEFFGGLAKRLSIIRDLEEEYHELITELVMLLANIFIKEVDRDNSDVADGIRYLFDIATPLHMNMFQQIYQGASAPENYVSESATNQLDGEEKQWRQGLIIGSKIDAVKLDTDYNLKIWCKAVVTDIRRPQDNGNMLIEVTFENDSPKTCRVLWWDSPDIDRYDTHSKQEDWRMDLQKDDVIDAFDNTRIWYLSTIQDKLMRKDLDYQHSQDYLVYKIGFRTYNPEGNKEDNNQRKFFGWSESFDEWIPAFSPRLQKSGSHAKTFDESRAQLGTQNYEDTIDDQMDLTTYEKAQLSGKQVFAMSRKKSKSKLLVSFLNLLGEQGVYSRILERISTENNDSLSLETVFYYLDCLSKCSIHWNKGFLNEYLPKLVEGVKNKILSSSEAIIKVIKKDRIDGIVQCLTGSLMGRMMSYRQREELKNTLVLEIGCAFLSQYNFLERRIDGAKMIQEVCKAANLLSYSGSAATDLSSGMKNSHLKQQQMQQVDRVIQVIKERGVLHQIFSRDRGHTQFVQRSEELLKLLISQDALSKEEMEFVWSTVKSGENNELEIYKIFNELASRLKLEQILFIIERLSKVPFQKVLLVQIQLVHEIAKRAVTGESAYGSQAVQYMWNIAFSDENIDKVLVNTAAMSLTDIIKNWETSFKLPLVKRITHALADNKDGYLCIKMLQAIFRDFQGSPESKQEGVQQYPPPPKSSQESVDSEMASACEVNQFSNKSEFINYVACEMGIMHHFFLNFQHYMLKARAGLRLRQQQEPQTEVKAFADKVLAERFMHSDQMNQRFDFLKFISQNSAIKINSEQLAILWDELVALQMFQSDTDLFFRFLKEVCDLQASGYQVVELRELIGFFKRNILAGGAEIVPRITIEGFYCIQSFFVLSNEIERRMERLNVEYNSSGGNQGSANSTVGTYPPKKFTSYSNTTGGSYQNYSFNQDKYSGGAEKHAGVPLTAESTQANEDIDFHIHVSPWDLEGIQGIWNLALDTTDLRVQDKATLFLLKLYTSVTFALESHIPQFEDSFIGHCIDGIKEMHDRIIMRIEPVKEEYESVLAPHAQFTSFSTTVLQKVLPYEEKRIIKYINLIKELIRISEREGTRGVRSHAALFKGPFLNCLQVGNSLKQNKKYQVKLEVGTYSNTTLFELRKLIGEHASRVYNEETRTYTQDTPVHPANIRVFRAVGCMDLKEIENGKTLAELRFKPNEVLTAFRRSAFSAAKVPLLNIDRSDLSERAKSVFADWFSNCSKPFDPNDPYSRRVMDRADGETFMKLATDEDIGVRDGQLDSMFETYDLNKDGLLELEDFLSFWRNAVYDKEEVVRVNLATYGYRYDLKRQPVDGMDDNMMQVRPRIEDMPRFKVAANSSYFDTIFDIIATTDTEVASAAWSLVRAATTNPELYWKVLALDQDPDFAWSDIFNAQNIHKMLYVLQIVEVLLEESSLVQEAHDSQTKEDILKRDWVSRFMLAGGFQQILSIFRKSLELISHKQADQLSKFEKNFLEQMLKLIKIFILAAYSVGDGEEGGSSNSVFEAIQLVKNASYQEQASGTELQQEQVKDKEMTEEAKDDAYHTPAKQVKGKFVDRFKARKVHFGVTEDFEITEEALFGDRDEPIKGEDESKNAESNLSSGVEKAAQQSPDDTKQRFSALAKIMRSSGLGSDILEKIDFSDLQKEILEVISIMLGKREILADDAQIIENALGLWVATLIKNGDLINEFYTFKREVNAPAYMTVVRNASDFIAQGIHTFKNTKIKEEFLSSVICISQKVKNTSGQKPVLYFIDLLRKNYPKEETYSLSRECKQFFDLFIALIGEYIGQLKAEFQSEDGNVLVRSEIDLFGILGEVIGKLKTHVTKESKGGLLEDKTQIGYFQMIEKMVVLLKPYDSQKSLARVITETGLVNEIFIGHLFYKQGYESILNENKSKTKESRAAAYQTLQKVIEVCEVDQISDFLENNVWNLIKDLPRPKKWKYVPADGQKSQYSSQYVGIANLGCICYMISMLQQFFMVPQFRYQLLQAIDGSAPDLKEYKGYVIDDNLLRQFQIMFANLELSERQAFYPLGFCFAYKDFEGNPTNTALQQDAQEFLNFFFARLEDLLKPTSQKYLLESVFGGKVCSQIICPACGNIRNLLESYYNLSVQVKDCKSLEASLQKMIQSSIINDFKCENCKQKVDVEKRQLIAEPPNVLIVNLQRIIFNFDTFQNDKINTTFEFPNTLNLKDYSFKSVMAGEGRPQEELYTDTTKHLMDIPDEEYVYKLVGVTIHRGTAEHGHYYSLINTKRGQVEEDENKPEWARTEKDPWRVFDDETVKHFTFSDLQQEAFGGMSGSAGSGFNDNDMQAYLFSSGQASSYGQNAYMLVYESMKKKPIKEVIIDGKKEDGEATLECANTAISRDAPQQVKHPEFEDDKGEKYRLIPYRSVQAFVPEWIKNQILEDNNLFLIDKYIYHESFFNLIKATIKMIAEVQVRNINQFSTGYWQMYHRLKVVTLKVAGKALFDMLAYYNLNTQMSDITSSLQTIFTFGDSQFTLNRGDPSLFMVFLQQAYLEDDCAHFLKIMFDCTDKTSRFYTGRLTSVMVNRIYQVYQDCLDSKQVPCQALDNLKSVADSLLIKLFKALKSPEAAKNWSKLEQYQKMLQEIATGGQLQAHLLLTSFEIVPFLLDFVLAHVNPKTSSKLNSFEHVVALICYFVRFSLTPAMRAECHLWVSKDEDQSQGIPAPASLKGYDVAQMRGKLENYPISVANFEYLIGSEFIEMVLKEGVQTEELGKMVAHLCYKFQKFSKKVAKLLLHGISRNDYEKIKNFLEVVTHLALVKDDLQRSRLEWMFGFGSFISQTANVAITNDQNEVLTKVGVKTLNSLSDECFAFKSSLIQDSVDDALLHLLWRYKGRMDTYTVNCLLSLLSLIAQDEAVADYFAELPGPTYCLARYTDWFKPYLERQLLDAKKGFSGSYSSQKEEIAVKCLSLFEKYEDYVSKKDGRSNANGVPTTTFNEEHSQTDVSAKLQPEKMDEDAEMPQVFHSGEDDFQLQEENVRNLIAMSMGDSEGNNVAKYQEVQFNAEGVLRSNPQPYVIVDCINEKTISNIDYGNVLLEITALGCFYTESLPTGDSNLAVPKNLFRKQKGGSIRPALNKVGSVNGSHVKNGPEYELQANCIQNFFQSAGLVDQARAAAGNTTPKKSYKADTVHQEDEEERMVDEEDEDRRQRQSANSGPVIKDDDCEWEKINKINTSLDDETDQQDGLIYKELGDGSNNQSEAGYKIKVIEVAEEVNPNHFSDNAFITASDMNAHAHTIEVSDLDHTNQGDNHNEQGQECEQAQNDQVAWPNEVRYCEDLCYRIQVVNYRDVAIKCSLSFVEDKPSSLFFPKGGFKAIVQPKQTKTILVLHKMRVDNSDSEDTFGAEINKLTTNFKFSERQTGLRQGSRKVNNKPVVPPINTQTINKQADNTNDALKNQDQKTAADANTSVYANESDDSEKRRTECFEFFDEENAVNVKKVGDDKDNANNDNFYGNEGGVYFEDNNMAGSDFKECPTCTYLNPFNNALCEMCYNQL